MSSLPTAANQTTRHNKRWKIEKNVFKQFSTDFNYKKWVATYSHWLDVTGEMKKNSSSTMNWKSGTILKIAILTAMRAVSLPAKVK